jgi:hypothetical protein
MAIAGTALKLKRLRQRFGIGAPRLAIRAHLAWYWRLLATVAVLSISLAAAAWIYDAGRRIAGFHSEESVREIESLKIRVSQLDEALSKYRGIAGSGESSLRIEHATQQQLVRQVKSLEAENAGLKQDLAFFEELIPASESAGQSGLKISRMRIEPETSSGQYRYRMLFVHNGGRQEKSLKGDLQLLVKVQQAGKDVMIIFPSDNERHLLKFRFEIKYFQRVEGLFTVPSGTLLKAVEARFLQDGVVRARQSVTL